MAADEFRTSGPLAGESGVASSTPGRCPNCFSRRHRVVERFRSEAVAQVVACLECDQMFTHPRPLLESLEELYPEDYHAHAIRHKRPRWHSSLRRRWDRFLLHLYKREEAWRTRPPPAWAALLEPLLSRFLDPYLLPVRGEGHLLDLGCGTGHYLARMRELGWEVLGVDQSRHAAAKAKREYDVPVVVSRIPNHELPEGRFDLVTAWQVLEHLDRPRLVLAWIRRLLAPQGRLVLTVPNQDGWAARTFGPYWYGLDLPRHLTHFTVVSLTVLLRAEGFRLVSLSTLGQSGWIRHSARARQRERPSLWSRGLQSRVVSRAISAAATARHDGETLLAVAVRA